MSEPENAGGRQEKERRRPGWGRRWVLRPLAWTAAALLVLLGAAGLYLTSDRFERRVQETLTARLGQALGRPVTVGDLDLALLPPTLTVRDLVIPGPEPADPPVATASTLEVEVGFESLRPLSLRLDRVWVERPRFLLRIDADGGTNLPDFAGAGGAEEEEGVQIAIGTLVVEGGALEINEASLPLDLEARGVRARLLGGAGSQLQGSVEAEEVTTELPGALPYPVAAHLELGIRPSGNTVDLLAARIEGEGLAADVRGGLRWDEEARGLELEVEARGTAAVLDRLGYLEGQVAGPWELAGALDWTPESWSFRSGLTSPALLVAGRPLQRVAADLTVTTELVGVVLTSASYAGGELSGQLRLAPAAPGIPAELDLTLRDLGILPLLAAEGVDLGGLRGEVSGTATYRFQAGDPLAGDGWAQLRVTTTEVAGRAIPVSGDGALTVSDGILKSDAIRLRTPRHRVLVEGLAVDLADGTGGFDYQVLSEDLGRLAVLFPPTQPGEEAPFWLPTAGEGRIEGRVRLGGEPIAEVRLDLTRVTTPLVTADTLEGSFTASARALADLSLEATHGEGAALVTGHVPLDENDPASLELAVEVAGLPLADAERFLDLGLPLEGPTTGRMELRQTSGGLAGRVSARVEPATAAGLDLDRVEADLAFDPDAVTFESLRLAAAAGEVEARGRLGLGPEGTLDLTLSAPALDLAKAPLSALTQGQLSGIASLSGSVRGSLQSPAAEARLAATGLDLGGHALGDAEVRAGWDGQELTASGSLLGLLRLDGGGAFDGRLADLSFRVESDSLGALVQLAAGEAVEGLGGSFDGRLAVTGPLEEPQVELSLEDLTVRHGQRTLRNREPVVARLEGSRLEVESLYMGLEGQDHWVFTAGSVDLADGTLDLDASGELGAGWSDVLTPSLRASGTVSAIATIRGTLEQPTVDGQARLENGRAVIPGFPHALEEVEAVVLLYPGRVVIDDARGRVAGGRIRLGGDLDLAGPTAGRYELRLAAQDLRLRYPEGWLLQGDANLILEPTDEGRLLAGEIRLDRASYLRDVDVGLIQLLGSVLARQRLEVGTADETLATTSLALDLEGPGALRVHNNLADLSGDLDLFVRGTLARPGLVGSVSLETGGTLVYADTEYKVERGLLTFASEDRIEPLIDLVAETRVREYEVQLALSGTLDRLEATFTSEPPLPSLDVLALVTTGQPVGGDSSQTLDPTRPGSRGQFAQAFLYGQAASAVTSRVQTLFGFDTLRVDPTASAGGSVDAARITVGKRVSRDLFVTYSRDPSETQNEEVRAEWQAAPGLVIILSYADGDSYAVDAVWEKKIR